MPRETKKEALAEKFNPGAPFLFDEANLPVRNELIERVRRYQHTGARLLEDDELTVKVIGLLMMDTPIKTIATNLNISPKTIRAARDELVKQGKLAPYKERVVRLFEQIIETGSENYLEALEKGTIRPDQLPVGLGIFFDKRALALGEPTSIGAVAGLGDAKRELSVEALNAFVAELSDAKSGVTPKEDPC
jgi:hypothetical protein